MIETLHPQTASPAELSRAEQYAFAEIIDRFDMPVDPELVEDVDACLYLNETLSSTDLQADKIAELRQAREELLHDFLERPRDAYVAEVLNYARLCENRSLVSRGTSGGTVTEFVTRDHEAKRVDMHFWINQADNGTVFITTEVPRKGEMLESAEPFYITASSTGEFSVRQRVWRRGQYEYVPMTLEEGGQGEARLREFFMFSTEAVHLAYTRQPEERAKADLEAKRLLIERKSYI